MIPQACFNLHYRQPSTSRLTLLRVIELLNFSETAHPAAFYIHTSNLTPRVHRRPGCGGDCGLVLGLYVHLLQSMECRINRLELRGSIERRFTAGPVPRMKKEAKPTCACCRWCMSPAEIRMRTTLDDAGVCNFKLNDHSSGSELHLLLCRCTGNPISHCRLTS